MFFESNGVPRAVEVVDRKSYESDASKSARGPARDKADPLLPGSVAAPMAGEVIEVKVKPGAASVHMSLVLCVITMSRPACWPAGD